MARTRQPQELDTTIAPALDAARKKPWEKAVERQRLPEGEPGPATPRPVPVKVEPVTFLYPQIPAYALGLGARICYFQHGKLTLDDAAEIADMRKHPLFGVRIFEEGKVPLKVQLGEGEGLDAHRARLVPKPIRTNAPRSAGPYAVTGAPPNAPSPQARRAHPAARKNQRDNEWG